MIAFPRPVYRRIDLGSESARVMFVQAAILFPQSPVITNDKETHFSIGIWLTRQGIAPLRLTYHKLWDSKVENVTVDVPVGRSSVTVQVPDQMSAAAGGSGKFTIALLSIVDGNGCERRLSAPAFEVDIDRRRPTARFAKSDKTVVTEGETVRPALRLTGTAPWEVSYSLNGGQEKRVVMRDPNNNLSLDEKGVYRLTKVSICVQGHCTRRWIGDRSKTPRRQSVLEADRLVTLPDTPEDFPACAPGVLPASNQCPRQKVLQLTW